MAQLTPKDIQRWREAEPHTFAGLSDTEVVRVGAQLHECPTEALVSELRSRGWIVRLEQ